MEHHWEYYKDVMQQHFLTEDKTLTEVMKLMNTVRAGVKGVIAEILPADESLVEFGDVLMRARPDV